MARTGPIGPVCLSAGVQTDDTGYVMATEILDCGRRRPTAPMASHNLFMTQRLKGQAAGVAIIRRILQRESFPNGFTTAEMYDLAVKEPAPEGFPSFPLSRQRLAPAATRKKKDKKGVVEPQSYPGHPDHPVRSIRFLKEFILPALAGQKEIAMMRKPTAKTLAALEAGELPKTTRLTASQFEWKWWVIPPEQRPKAPAPKPAKRIVGLEVGVDSDTSHLNKRRQEARVGKVSREVEKLKAYSEFSQRRDALMDRLEKDSELTLQLAERMERLGNRSGLNEVLEEERVVRSDRSRRGTSIASNDSNEFVRSRADKIRQLVAYKAGQRSRGLEAGTR
ncbi:hypothetical protein CVT26_007940 [Gymnopilus dilepis]|uniref:Uncharacterized protein n=1 Tax=Gymnopilus dilepis TaxID=231916 RepID=A0A409W7R9_9AGAR|nr:hypothetical protein CVT26_007940 [Gymnopilus dilepis]